MEDRMLVSWEHPRISPEELYNLLRKNGLLPLHLGDQQMLEAIRVTAMISRFGIVHYYGDVMASLLYWPIAPGVLGAQWIPEVKKLHTRKDELIEIGKELRAIWFRDGVYRVEAQVPTSRTQTIRALKALGFRQETLDAGLRSAVNYGRGPENICVLGFLETDPPRALSARAPMSEVEEVVNG